MSCVEIRALSHFLPLLTIIFVGYLRGSDQALPSQLILTCISCRIVWYSHGQSSSFLDFGSGYKPVVFCI